MCLIVSGRCASTCIWCDMHFNECAMHSCYIEANHENFTHRISKSGCGLYCEGT